MPMTNLTTGGGGSGITLGDPVTGAAPNGVFFADALGNLAQDTNFTWDGTELRVLNITSATTANMYIRGKTAALGSNNNGAGVFLEAGNADGIGVGGQFQLAAGDGDTTGDGGAATIGSGYGGTAAGNAGNINLLGGSAQGLGLGGSIIGLAGNGAGGGNGGHFSGTAGNGAVGGYAALTAGDATISGNPGGASTLTAGTGSGSGGGGAATIQAGTGGATGSGGDAGLYGGPGGATSGTGGSALVIAGNGAGTDSNGGDVFIYTGAKTGAGVNGKIRLTTNHTAIGIIHFDDLTTDRTYAFPDKSGTIALTSDITGGIPQLSADPGSPTAQTAWVLKTGGGGVGGGKVKIPLGLGGIVPSVGTGGGSPTYQFSYRTLEGTTKRVTLA